MNADETVKAARNLGAPSGVSVVEAVIDAIVLGVTSRRFPPGERIPTEQDLAAELDVGRNSVREAVKILVAMGILEIRRADGTFVVDGFSPRMLGPAVYGLLLRGNDEFALMDLRRTLETGAFRLAVERCPEAEIAVLAASHDALCDAVRAADVPTILRTDIGFHRQLRRIAGNPILGYLCDTVDGLVGGLRERLARQTLETDGGSAVLARHTAMFRVVAERDAAAAVFVGDELFDLLERMGR